MSAKDLAKNLLERLQTTDLDGFTGLLTHSLAVEGLAVEAVAHNKAEVFLASIDHPSFLAAVLPYTDLRIVVTFTNHYVFDTDPKTFLVFVQSRPEVWDHLQEDALEMLAKRCLKSDLYPPLKQVAHSQFFETFLDQAPEHVLHKQFDFIRRQWNREVIDFVEHQLTRRQKMLLEQHIDDKSVLGSKRKI